MATTEQLIYQLNIAVSQQSASEISKLIDQQKQLKALLASLPQEGTTAYKQLDAAIIEASKGTKTLADTQRELTQQYANGAARVQDFNRALKQGAAERGSINDLRNQVIAVNRELDNTARTLNGKTNPAYAELSKKSAQLTNDLKAAEAESSRFQRNVGNYPQIGEQINSVFTQVGETFVAAFAITNIINAVKSGFQEIVSVGTDFARVRSTLLGLNEGRPVDRLVDDAKRLGAATEFTASEVGNLQIAYTKLGFNQEEILQTTQATLNLATATGEDLARSAEVAGSTLRAYGLDADQTVRVTDVMAKSFSATALDLNKFAEAQKLIGPIARQLNFSLEDVTALLGGLANAGIDGSLAGTSLRNAFLKLADPTSAINRELAKLGGEFSDGIQSSEEYIRALKALQEQNLDLGKVLEVTDVRSVTAISTLISASDTVGELSNQFRNAAGAGQRMADIIRDDVQGDMDVLSSTVEGLALNLFDSLEPSLRSVIQIFTVFVSGINGLVDIMQTVPGLLEAVVGGTIAYGVALIATRVRILGFTAAEVASKVAVAATNTAKKAAALVTALYSVAVSLLQGNLVAATITMRAFTVAIASNPIGLLAVGVGLAVGALVALTRQTKKLTQEQEFQVKIQKDLADAYAKEVTASEKLFRTAKNDQLSRAARVKAIEAINTQFKRYLPNLLTEESTLKDIEIAQRAVNKAIFEKIQLQLRDQKIGEAFEKSNKALFESGLKLSEQTGVNLEDLQKAVNASIQVSNKLTEEQSQSIKDASVSVDDFGILLIARLREVQRQSAGTDVAVETALQNIIEQLRAGTLDAVEFASSFDQMINAAVQLEKDLGSVDKVFGTLGEELETITGSSKTTIKSLAELREELKAIREAQETVSDKQGFDKLEKDAKRVQAAIDAITGSSEKQRKATESATKALEKRLDTLNNLIQKQRDDAAVEEEESVAALRAKQEIEAKKLEATFNRIDQETASLLKAGVKQNQIEVLTASDREELRKQLSQRYNALVADLLKKESEAQTAAIQEAVAKTLDAIALGENERLLAQEQSYQQRREAARGNDNLMLEIDEQHEQDILRIRLEAIKKQLQVADIAASERIQLERNALAVQAELADNEVEIVRRKEEAKRKLIEEGKRIQQEALNSLKSLISQLTQATQEQAQAQIDLLQRNKEERTQAIDDQIAQNERLRQERIKEIEESNLDEAAKEAAIAKENERFSLKISSLKNASKQENAVLDEQIKLEEERKNKAADIERRATAASQAAAQIQLAINAATTLSNNIKAVSSAAAIPFPANLFSIVTIVTALASAIASVKALTQSSRVQLEDGGQIGRDGQVRYGGNVKRRRKAEGGLHVGPRHSEGGMTIEVEGGEFEVNREATSMFLQDIAWMNAQGLRKKRGLPYSTDFGARGALRASIVPTPRRIFQTGGLVTPSTPQTSESSLESLVANFEGLQATLNTLVEVTRDKQLTVSTREIQRKELQYSRLEKKSST